MASKSCLALFSGRGGRCSFVLNIFSPRIANFRTYLQTYSYVSFPLEIETENSSVISGHKTNRKGIGKGGEYVATKGKGMENG